MQAALWSIHAVAAVSYHPLRLHAVPQYNHCRTGNVRPDEAHIAVQADLKAIVRGLDSTMLTYETQSDKRAML